MNYTSRDLINIALKRHEHCEHLIAEMVKEVNKTDSAYTFAIAMREFEMVLQTVLIKSAVADGELEGFEEFFIQNIIEYADMIESINSELMDFSPDWVEISWEDFYDMPQEDKEMIANVAFKIASGYAQELVSELAKVDKAIKEKNYLEMLNEDVIAIVLAFAGVDGDSIEGTSAEQETLEGLSVYNELINLKWSEITGE